MFKIESFINEYIREHYPDRSHAVLKRINSILKCLDPYINPNLGSEEYKRLPDNEKFQLVQQSALIIIELIKPNFWLRALFTSAENRLVELNIRPTTWEGLTPRLGRLGKMTFSVTSKTEKELGPKIKSTDGQWSAWRAARIAAVSSLALETKDPILACHLGMYLQSRSAKKIREIKEAARILASKSRAKSEKPGKSEWLELLRRIKSGNKKMSWKRVTGLIQQNSLTLKNALEVPTPLRLSKIEMNDYGQSDCSVVYDFEGSTTRISARTLESYYGLMEN